MITIGDINCLIAKWTCRAGNPLHDLPYKDALNECIMELNELVVKSVEEELDYQDFLSSKADDYLSSMEAHEQSA